MQDITLFLVVSTELTRLVIFMDLLRICAAQAKYIIVLMQLEYSLDPISDW